MAANELERSAKNIHGGTHRCPRGFEGASALDAVAALEAAERASRILQNGGEER
jgi:hypothetical protein